MSSALMFLHCTSLSSAISYSRYTIWHFFEYGVSVLCCILKIFSMSWCETHFFFSNEQRYSSWHPGISKKSIFRTVFKHVLVNASCSSEMTLLQKNAEVRSFSVSNPSRLYCSSHYTVTGPLTLARRSNMCGLFCVIKCM